jgi:2-polyprenyl-3-methyl-5-hydroxy-6-metoxy-1,4-benzoquinol methylase
MEKTTENIQEWEKVEAERSAKEAQHINIERLRMNKENIAKYMNPPADTPYYLEYSYYILGDVRGKTVLDFGCGTGENTMLVALRGAKVIGLDISEDLIQLAKERLKINEVEADVSFIACSTHEIDLPDESVDVVFGIAILHHLELPLVAKEVHRILKKGGRAIFKNLFVIQNSFGLSVT